MPSTRGALLIWCRSRPSSGCRSANRFQNATDSGCTKFSQSRFRSTRAGVVLCRMFASEPSGLYIGMTTTVSSSRICWASWLPLLPSSFRMCRTACVLCSSLPWMRAWSQNVV